MCAHPERRCGKLGKVPDVPGEESQFRGDIGDDEEPGWSGWIVDRQVDSPVLDSEAPNLKVEAANRLKNQFRIWNCNFGGNAALNRRLDAHAGGDKVVEPAEADALDLDMEVLLRELGLDTGGEPLRKTKDV